MARYEITDNKTGKSVVVEGSKPPTTTDAEAIFQKAGLRQTTTQEEPQKGILGQVTDFLLPRSKGFLNDQVQNSTKRKSLGEVTYESIPVLNLLTNLEDGKIKLDKKGLGAAGELASYMIPGNKLLKEGSGLQKIAGGALQGAEIGAVSGATDPNADTLKNRVEKGVTNAVIGGVTGGVVQGLFEVGKAGFQKLVGNAADKIKKIIRPNPSTLDKFKKNTGLDYAEEVVKKDAKNIEGMDYPQLESYFKGKFQDAVGKVDSELENSGKTIDKKFIQNTFEVVSNLYKDRPIASEKIGQDFAKYIEYVDKLPDQIPLQVANQIKRDLQELASSAYGNTSNSVPKAYKKVASGLNKEIVRIYPQAGELNKETQLYKLVSDAVSRTASREGNKISTSFVDKLLQTLPTSAGIGVGLMTGDPLAGIGTLLAGAGASKAREVVRSPQVQTSLASMIQKGVSPRLNAFGRVLGDTVRKGSSIMATR